MDREVDPTIPIELDSFLSKELFLQDRPVDFSTGRNPTGAVDHALPRNAIHPLWRKLLERVADGPSVSRRHHVGGHLGIGRYPAPRDQRGHAVDRFPKRLPARGHGAPAAQQAPSPSPAPRASRVAHSSTDSSTPGSAATHRSPGKQSPGLRQPSMQRAGRSSDTHVWPGGHTPGAQDCKQAPTSRRESRSKGGGREAVRLQ